MSQVTLNDDDKLVVTIPGLGTFELIARTEWLEFLRGDGCIEIEGDYYDLTLERLNGQLVLNTYMGEDAHFKLFATIPFTEADAEALARQIEALAVNEIDEINEIDEEIVPANLTLRGQAYAPASRPYNVWREFVAGNLNEAPVVFNGLSAHAILMESSGGLLITANMLSKSDLLDLADRFDVKYPHV